MTTRTATTLAAENGHANIVRVLAAHPGVDVSQALCAASACGLTSLVMDLIYERGADVNAVGGDLRTVADAAAWRGHADLLHELADVDGIDASQLLIAAATVGAAGLVADCLQRGADVTATDAFGTTALHRARWHAHAGIVATLRAAGARG